MVKMEEDDLMGLPIPKGYEIEQLFHNDKWFFVTPSNLDSVDLYGNEKGLYDSEYEAIGGAFDHYMTSNPSGG